MNVYILMLNTYGEGGTIQYVTADLKKARECVRNYGKDQHRHSKPRRKKHKGKLIDEWILNDCDTLVIETWNIQPSKKK